MWLKKELNFDVCEHINKLRVKEFEKKKQEDAQDLKKTIQDFTEFIKNNDEGRYDHELFQDKYGELDMNECQAARDLTYELYDLYIGFCDEICEEREKIMYDMLYDNIDEFFQVVLKYGVEHYGLDEDDDRWIDIDWDDVQWELSGLTQYINDIMTEDNFVRFTSKKVSWYCAILNEVLIHVEKKVDKRCKAYKRGKIDASNSLHTFDEDLVRNLWNRRECDAINKIVKKWMKTKN